MFTPAEPAMGNFASLVGATLVLEYADLVRDDCLGRLPFRLGRRLLLRSLPWPDSYPTIHIASPSGRPTPPRLLAGLLRRLRQRRRGFLTDAAPQRFHQIDEGDVRL